MRNWLKGLGAAVVLAASVYLPSDTLAKGEAGRIRAPQVEVFQASSLRNPAPLQGGMATQLVRLGAFPLDHELVASIDPLQMAAAPLRRPVRFAFEGTRIADADGKERLSLPLPPPNRWTSVLATIALGMFFFLRRIV